MTIRSATIVDAREIQQLVMSLSKYYLISRGVDIPQWLLDTLAVEKFEHRIQADNYLNLVCEENGKLQGYISIKNNEHLFHLFVDETCQENGVARQLWEKASDICQADVYTVRSSVYAVPVYKRFGFKPVGELVARDGVGYQEMQLRVLEMA